MANILESYLLEVKRDLNQFLQDCRSYNLPYNSIKNVLELLICIDKDPNTQKEVIELLFLQMPELLHIQMALIFIENISQLFSGSLKSFIMDEEEKFIFLSKNLFVEEMKRLEIYRDNYDEININETDVMIELKNISL